MTSVSFEKLLQLAQQRALDGKGGLAASITKMCLQADVKLTPEETKLTYDILHELIHEVEMEVRRYVADYLAHRMDVPNTLLEFLANDSIHVAYPILVYSGQLTDDFLVDLIGRKQRGHHIAIAERGSLSEKITDALIATDDEIVACKVMENPGAKISDSTLELLIERSVDIPQLQYKILSRRDLPESIAHRMFIWVGEATRQYILRNYQVPDDLLNAAISDALTEVQSFQAAVNEATSMTNAHKTKQAERLYRLLHAEGKQAFIVEFSYTTGITLSVAEMIFDLSQVNTIAIACKAVGFNQSQFSDLLKKFLEEKYTNFADNSLIDKAVRYFARISDEKAEKYMDSWRESSATIRKTFK